jgi:di/tricarboxylate transporter
VLLVDSPEVVRRQAIAMGPGGLRAVSVVAGLVVLLATGVIPPAVAALIAACAMILFRVLSVDQAYRGIDWTTLVLIAAMIPLSAALTITGAGEKVARLLIDVAAGLGPYALLAGLFLLTAVLGQVVSNMATALIMIPIGLSAAADAGMSARPVLMCVTVAAAGAFLTPVATPVNLMVMAPGGYRFGDYWRLGLPLLMLFFVVAVFLVPVFWRF